MNLDHCPKCGKPRIHFKHTQHSYSLCNHKQTTEKSGISRIESHVSKLNRLISYVAENQNTVLSEENFQKMMDLVPDRANYQFPTTENTMDFHHDLLVRTMAILPVKMDSLELAERFYIVKNNLSQLPRCEFCGGEVTFVNRFVGFRKSCSKCRNKLGDETRSINQNSRIEEVIDKSKYEIVSFPGLVNFNPLVIRCKNCGKTTKLFVMNGKIEQLSGKPLCRHCETNISKPEEELKEFCASLVGAENLIENDRTAIAPKELDIYIPDRKFAIEFNGLYWHSDNCEHVSKNTDGKNRHIEKTELCGKAGIRLVQIFEDEWNGKRNIVKSRIREILGMCKNSIYARNCEIVELDGNETAKFLNENHLQGNSNSNVRLGLKFNDELVSVMTFSKPRFDKTHQWELVRFCNKIDFRVVGGASRLLKKFERKYHPKDIVSYADIRWSVGNLYEKLGFTLTHKSSPNYWYVKNGVRESRIKYQKHNLKNILGDGFDSSLSESENMKNAGYGRIYDCGNLVYVKTFNQ